MNCRTCIRARSIAALCGVALLVTTGIAAAQPKKEEDQKFYYLGVALGTNISEFQLTKKELEIVTEGLTDAVMGRSGTIDQLKWGAAIQELREQRRAAASEAEKEEAVKFLAEAQQANDAVVTDSGLIITQLQEGSGASPAPTDTVKVHYHGTLRDGSVFDSSVDRGTPAQFSLNRVIPCWTEGVGMMKVGGKSKLVCPSAIAYGERGAPPKIPGNAALTFEVELIEIVSQ